MPEKRTLDRARKAKEEGKAPSTQAGEFVRETIRHIRQGVHGARSAKQAIAIGLSKARRHRVTKPSPKRSRVTLRALRREGKQAASSEALARHAHGVARKKSPTARHEAARKAAQTRKTKFISPIVTE